MISEVNSKSRNHNDSVRKFAVMKPPILSYTPIEGKTYTLFGSSDSTHEYYQTIRALAARILIENELETVLMALRKYSPNKQLLKKILRGSLGNSLISFILKTIHEPLKQYTRATAGHLESLSLWKKLRDHRLSTTEEQYHLYMLEIELTNRLNRLSFIKADRKISLQPYCLKDQSVSCKAKKKGRDYQCTGCSRQCFQHAASRILKENQIDPLIWMGGSISKTAIAAHRDNQSFGILGIACIPELVWGMRKCMKYGIPVVGIPLNANRCIRWWGEFHPNSIDLAELENLLTDFRNPPINTQIPNDKY